MSGALLYGGVVGLASGIVFRSFFFFDVVTVGMVCATIALVIALLCFSQLLTMRAAAASCAGILFFIVGVCRFAFVEQAYERTVSAVAPYESSTIAIEGVVVRDVEKRDNGIALYVAVDHVGSTSIDTVVRAQANLRNDLMYGDRVRVEGRLERPSAFETDLGRTFYYEEYLRAQDVTHTISFAHVSMIEHTSGPYILRPLFVLKHRFIESIELLLPEPHAGLATGLLLGEKRALGPEVEMWFRTVGIIHIIVLSGYNLTIVAESIMRLLAFIPRIRVRLFIGACAIFIFALLVGLSATVVRASVMALLVLLARATGRTYAVLRALMCTAGIMLLWNPYVLAFDPGFQLSFLATLGLIFCAPIVERKLGYVPSRLGVREYVTATIATQIFVLPFLLYAIGSVSLVALFVNVFVLLFVPLTMLVTFFIGLAGMVFGMSALLFAYPAYLLLAYILAIAEWGSRVPYASISVERFSMWFVVAAYILLTAGIRYLYMREELHVDQHKTSNV